jgi:L-ascorbate metabolism protein UlaG (beta-lactamase superfamily)
MAVPVYPLTAAELARRPASGLRLTWLGHSTVWADIDGCRVLFDPVWSHRCSPFPFVGPRRLHPPPLPLAELPRVDVVVISHDHYDHLDMPTIRTLVTASKAHFAVPLGTGAHLEHWGVPSRRIIELDWHETGRLAGVSVTAAPARHYCGRGLSRSRTTLWASWVIAGTRHTIFHAGDTGPTPELEAIGSAYGPFDATMMPIGAYDELWPDVHLTPEQAVRGHQALRGKVLLPIHWATFPLAPHPWAEPIERTLSAAQEGAHGTVVATVRPGQPYEPHCPPPMSRWWQAAEPTTQQPQATAENRLPLLSST